MSVHNRTETISEFSLHRLFRWKCSLHTHTPIYLYINVWHFYKYTRIWKKNRVSYGGTGERANTQMNERTSALCAFDERTSEKHKQWLNRRQPEAIPLGKLWNKHLGACIWLFICLVYTVLFFICFVYHVYMYGVLFALVVYILCGLLCPCLSGAANAAVVVIMAEYNMM